MKVKEYLQCMPFEFFPDKKGTKYRIGGKFKNHGEYCESSVKFALGLEYLVNPSISFDKGSDIPQLNASVKSFRFSLAESLNGQTFDEQFQDYFNRCVSTLWIYVISVNDKIIEYHMDKNEFQTFVKMFCTLEQKSNSQDKKIRMKNISERKVIEWLESFL